MVASDVGQATHGAGELSVELLRVMVDHTAAPFLVIDHAGAIRYAGGSVVQLGWDPSSLVGQNVAGLLAEEQHEVAAQAMTEFVDGKATADGAPITFRLRRPDGSQHWVEVGGTPACDTDGAALIVLRLRQWDASHHLGDFLVALTEARSLDDVLAPLTRAIVASSLSLAATVHHGFDGTAFDGCVTSWDGPPRLPLVGGPWSGVVAGAESLTLDDDLPDGAPPGATTCWLVPIPAGELVGASVLTVWRDRPGAPLLGHRMELDRAAVQVDLALRRTAEHDRLSRLARYDVLTGVKNRAAFGERLTDLLEQGEPGVAVAFCDLDRFKPVNDRYGHRIGDDVLVEVAARLRTVLRRGDDLGRIGGDEFTVIFRDVADSSAAGALADRLMRAVEEPFTVADGVVHLGMSIGIALADPGSTADELLSAADTALYACKRAGGNRRAVVG